MLYCGIDDGWLRVGDGKWYRHLAAVAVAEKDGVVAGAELSAGVGCCPAVAPICPIVLQGWRSVGGGEDAGVAQTASRTFGVDDYQRVDDVVEMDLYAVVFVASQFVDYSCVEPFSLMGCETQDAAVDVAVECVAVSAV